jgi:hypothetical protein
MGRPHWHPKTCKVCGVGAREGVSISQRGYCAMHWEERMIANHVQLKAHSGPFFDHWRRRSLAALGVIVLDEPESGR